jgi:hypothetical protein
MALGGPENQIYWAIHRFDLVYERGTEDYSPVAAEGDAGRGDQVCVREVTA